MLERQRNELTERIVFRNVIENEVSTDMTSNYIVNIEGLKTGQEGKAGSQYKRYLLEAWLTSCTRRSVRDPSGET